MGKFKVLFLGLMVLMLLGMYACNTNNGLPLQHPHGCIFKTPEALAQSVALALRDEDFTCAGNYLPGMGKVFGMQSTNENDTAVADFGNKAEHVLVQALKKELSKLRTEIIEKGGNISKLQLEGITQTEKEGVTHIIMRLSAGKLKFTMQPVGLFNNEGSWYLLGSRFTTSFD